MSVQSRKHVQTSDHGAAAMVFLHGSGYVPRIWRFLAPACRDRFRIITYDLTGCGWSRPIDAFPAQTLR